MAKYLWVGMGPTGASLSGTNIVDQYCFNKSGNWYTKQIVNGTLRWATSAATPAGGDQVVFGGEYSDYFIPSTGWTAAKSPCLFGGFSGGVGAGVWGMTGATASSGTTFTSSMLGFVVDRTGVSFGYRFPYLGGGISGDIATWCAARDSVGVTYYTAANSTGFRDPSQNLRLKWRFAANMDNARVFQASDADGITNPANHTWETKFVVDFDAVKAPTALAGGTGGTGGVTGTNPLVSTTLYFNAGYGAGLRVRGGSFKDVQINTQTYPNLVNGNSYSYIADSGIEIYNAYIDTLTVSKAQATYISGCTASVINVYNMPWDTATTDNTYLSQVDMEIASNISAISSYTDLYGITLSTDLPPTAGALNLNFVPWNINGMSEVVSSAASTSPTKSVVILGDRVNGRLCSVPTININAGSVMGSGLSANSGYLYMPWAVEFAGSVNCNTINNNAGYIYSNADIDATATVNVSELKMSNYGTLDFSKRNSGFDDWRFGGFTAAGTQIAGGIFFLDETTKVLGSAGLRLWNTQTKAGGVINTRITDTKSYSIPNTTA